jgi:hypothetical protein
MIEAPVNRIKAHLPQPKTARERGDNYIATLQLALATLQDLMTSHQPEMRYKATMAMLDIEKTRLRHGRALAGTDTSEALDWDELIKPDPEPEPEQVHDEEPVVLDKAFFEEFDRMMGEAIERDGIDKTIANYHRNAEIQRQREVQRKELASGSPNSPPIRTREVCNSNREQMEWPSISS